MGPLQAITRAQSGATSGWHTQRTPTPARCCANAPPPTRTGPSDRPRCRRWPPDGVRTPTLCPDSGVVNRGDQVIEHLAEFGADREGRLFRGARRSALRERLQPGLAEGPREGVQPHPGRRAARQAALPTCGTWPCRHGWAAASRRPGSPSGPGTASMCCCGSTPVHRRPGGRP